MLKKIIFVLSFVIIMLTFSLTAFANGGGYRDWAREHIEKAILAEIVPMELQKDYNLNITRGEVAQLLWNVYKNNFLGDFEVIYKFDDPVPHASADMLYSLGVVKGVSENYFGVEEEITFEQFACMLSRMANLYELEEGKIERLSFSDIEEVSFWALADIERLYSMGLVQGNSENKLYPSRKITRKEAISLVWRLNYAITEEDILVYGDTNENFLVEAGYVTEEEFNKEKYITNIDALWALFNVKCGELNEYELKKWYAGDTLANFDYLDDNTKMLLLSFTGSYEAVFSTLEDIAKFGFDEYITNYEALLYVLNVIGNTDSCVAITSFAGSDDKQLVLDMAHNKGLTESKLSIEDADIPIERKEYFKILHRALFVNFNRGGDSGAGRYRLIDRKNIPKYEPQVKEREIVPIDVNYIVHNDLSITWNLKEDLKFIETEKDYWCKIEYVFKDGTYDGWNISTSVQMEIDGEEVIETFKRYSDKPAGYRISYYQYEGDKEYVFEITLPKYEIREDGNEIKPGRYIRYPKAWTAKEITLGEGTLFDEDAYYLIIARDHSYRKAEYNVTSICCFMPEYADYKYVAPSNRTFGVSIYEDMRLQKVKVSGNKRDGFIITFTPESSDTFEIVEYK